jgi:hypothetical protein
VQIAATSMALLGLLLFLLQVAAREIGYRLGRRHAERRNANAESVGVIVGGMLGLLAFVLALTLSFNNQRYEERRAGALAEANAIGTAWLRAYTVGHPRGPEIARLVEEYAALRTEFVRASATSTALDAMAARSGALQAAIWGQMAGIAEERRDAMAESLQRALNDAFDLGAAERYAFNFPMPAEYFWLLLGLTAVSMGAVGYQLGLRGTPLHALSLALIGMWTLVMLVIVDLGTARLGRFQTSTEPYEWTLQGFQGGVVVPPMAPAAR